MASKVSMLGAAAARRAVRSLGSARQHRHLLQDLEDAVFIFNRERRLVFASGSVEKFLGTMRADLAGTALGDVFPPTTTLGLLMAQAAPDRPAHA